MEKKIYKYNETRASLQGIIKKKAEEDFILLIQVNSATAAKSKIIYDYCKIHNLKIKFVNHKKIKIIFKNTKQNALLQKVNNSMFLIQGVDYIKDCLKFYEYCKSIGFENSLLIISVFIRSKDNVFEYTLEEFRDLINNKKKETIKVDLYNMIKIQTIIKVIKLLKVLNIKVDDNNKSSKE